MLSKRQWLWFADNHTKIRMATISLLSVLFVSYVLIFLNRFLWQRNVPITSRPAVSQMEKFRCNTDEVYQMFIPSEAKQNVSGENLKSESSEIQNVGDARSLFLEFYGTSRLGSEILEKRPDCLGAFIADKQFWPEPYAILVVDRTSGKTLFRIARLQGYLSR